MADEIPNGETPAGDALPQDLDVTAYVGPYVFPDIRRRRIAAAIYVVLGAASLAIGITSSNRGLILAGVILGVIALYHFVAGWHLAVDQTEALAVASRTVGFPVGHASAQLGWRGLLSRPAWRILVYSAEDPPAQRGLVLVDGVQGQVLEWFVEDNPEDWSQLD